MYAYNCTKHSVTGSSPYFLLSGKNPKLPIDIILSEHQEPTNEQPNYNNFKHYKHGQSQWKKPWKLLKNTSKYQKKPSKYKEN